MKRTLPSQILSDQLVQLHCMETQIARALPILAGSVLNIRLRRLLSGRAISARERCDTLEDLLKRYASPAARKTLNSIRGILAEGNTELTRIRNPRDRDVVMIEHCLRIEQHATTAYGIAVPRTNRMGFPGIAARFRLLLSDLETARPSFHAVEAEVFSLAGHSPFQESAANPYFPISAISGPHGEAVTP